MRRIFLFSLAAALVAACNLTSPREPHLRAAPSANIASTPTDPSPPTSSESESRCTPPPVAAGFLPWSQENSPTTPSSIEREGKVADVYWFPPEGNAEFSGAYVQLRRYPYSADRRGTRMMVRGADATLERGATNEATVHWSEDVACSNYSVLVDLDRSGGSSEQAAEYAHQVANALEFEE